jgi:hypothetical protein
MTPQSIVHAVRARGKGFFDSFRKTAPLTTEGTEGTENGRRTKAVNDNWQRATDSSRASLLFNS